MELRNDTSYEIDPGFVEKTIEFVLEREGRKGEVSVAFVGVDEMGRLNEEYRKGKGPTDVLTFPYGDKELLGEIIVCPEVVEMNAKEFGNSFEREMLLTLVHSALHLCGYDHEFSQENAREMFQKQEKYFKELLETFNL